jgi:hypothetical protein
MHADTPAVEPTKPADVSSPRLQGKLWLFAVVSLAVVGILVLVAQRYSNTEQYAENWIAGIAAGISVLNVLLTFYLLRTAQVQLGILRDDLHDQGIRHEREMEAQEARRLQEAQQARADLESMQALLDAQTEALALARSDAQEAQRETAMSRYDLSAPRCSIRPLRAAVMLRKHGSGEPDIKITEDKELPTDVDNYTLTVHLTFNIKNWGQEPIYYFLGGRLEPTGYFVLDPGQEEAFSREVSHSVRQWMAIAKGEINVEGQAAFIESDPARIEVPVNVNEIGNGVVDMHTWGGSVMPITVQEFGVVAHAGAEILKRAHPIAFRKRDYVHLRQEQDAS